MKIFLRQRAMLALSLSVLLSAPVLANPLPTNLGSGLRQLVERYQQRDQSYIDALKLSRLGQSNTQGHFLVNIYLDGKLPLANLKTKLQDLGLRPVAEQASYRHGVISAYLPLDKAVAVANFAGVRSLALVPKPLHNVGKVTSQGAAVLKTDQVNSLGFLGAGITVGVLSDSYDTATGDATSAAQDVLTGDLPGVGNPNGYTTPVTVLEDFPGGTDEGRGMAQIVSDLAPAAKLCFATADVSDVDFAANIVALHTDSRCGASVVVDDVIYLNEPFFSDGIIAQAVDTVSGLGVPYFSSAGNRGNYGYVSTFRKVSVTAVKNLITAGSENLKLSTVPSALLAGGFHNFKTSGGTDVTQNITIDTADTTLVFQWDDPFNTGAVSTDYNILVFDSAGNYLASNSGVDVNSSTDQPIELISLPAGRRGAAVTYQIALTRATGTTATRLRYEGFVNGTFAQTYYTYNTPTTFGHNSAKGANGTAAYYYQTPTVPESFTSAGPVTIYFDSLGTRLTTPEVRKKPDIAAIDGVDTTFFPPGALSSTDSDASGYPNFFGTSAAAPHAAGVAALLLNAAGGPGSLTPQQVKSYLQTTGAAHDLDPSFSKAVAKKGSLTFTVTATGDQVSSSDPNFFKVTFTGPSTTSLSGVNFNLAGATLEFDSAGSGSYPFTLGNLTGLTATDITLGTLPDPSQTLSLTFAPGSFTTGDILAFGVDRDVFPSLGGGNTADLLAGATVSGTFGTTTLTATFVNVFGKGYSVLDGYGLINALDAVNLLP